MVVYSQKYCIYIFVRNIILIVYDNFCARSWVPDTLPLFSYTMRIIFSLLLFSHPLSMFLSNSLWSHHVIEITPLKPLRVMTKDQDITSPLRHSPFPCPTSGEGEGGHISESAYTISRSLRGSAGRVVPYRPGGEWARGRHTEYNNRQFGRFSIVSECVCLSIGW